ncbi:MAG: FHA domain-containing protein [Myxococcota bacterium]|nr:FHA domain-containing protein [Myxococcota bacterium]
MFTIVISEKGGAERREGFDKNEINVGRVQGNDLTLAKGNVSKHHARLLLRESRFIVTDLKSTNGTYVNGRKISQATIVREGDKIYIGDFVLQLETGSTSSLSDKGEPSHAELASPSRASGTPSPPGDNAATAPPAAVNHSAGPRHPSPPPLPAAMFSPPESAHASAGPGFSSTPPLVPSPSSHVPLAAGGNDGENLSHFPLERDPDDSDGAPELRGALLMPKLPGPPRIPQQNARVHSETATLGGVPARGGTLPGATAPPLVRRAPRSSSPPALRPILRETSQQAARKLALITLIDRVADVIDLGPLDESPVVSDAMAQSIRRAVEDQANAMRTEGEVLEGLDLDLLIGDAVRELVDVGPIGALLDDEETSEVHVSRPDAVFAVKNGEFAVAEVSFTSEAALERAIGRLAQQSGEPVAPGELLIERRVARGAHMIAIAPPAAGSWALVVRKRRRVEASLDALVRSGSMSIPIAAFLAACVAARANVLVVGPGLGAVSTTLGALASAAPQDRRVTVLQGMEEIATGQANVVSLALVDNGPRGERLVRASARLGADHLVIASLAGAVAGATIDVIGEGSEGVIAGVGAPSLRQALARLVAQIALVRPGALVEAAREAVGESFDIAVEVMRGADGEHRVVRVAELGGADAKGVVFRDLFVLRAEAEGPSSFAATGTTPRLASDFAARGIKLDPGLFRRR